MWHSPGNAEEMTSWDRRVDASGGRMSPSVRVTSVGGQRLPTCGLVLGEVTLLGEEGTGQHLKSNPASFYPGLTN